MVLHKRLTLCMFMKSIFSLLSVVTLCLPVLPLSAAAPWDDEAEPAPFDEEEDVFAGPAVSAADVQAQMEQPAQAVRDATQVLQGVTDLASADAAAADYYGSSALKSVMESLTDDEGVTGFKAEAEWKRK